MSSSYRSRYSTGGACTRTAAVFFAAGILAAAGCGSNASSDDSVKWTVTDPGTGATSTGELSPTWPGVRRSYQDGSVTTALGFTERWGRTLVRFQGIDDVRYFHRGEAGLLYDGTTRIGQLSPPLMLLPSAIKDGMKWQVLGSTDQPLGTYTVAAQGERTTIFGKLPIWRLSQHNEVTGNEFWTEYAEGRGTVAADDKQVVAAVVPLAPRTARQVRPRLSLTAFGDGLPLSRETCPTTAGGQARVATTASSPIPSPSCGS